MNRKGIPATLYLHPREVDPNQPRLTHLKLGRKFKYYVNLKQTERKLRAVLQRYSFIGIRDYLATPMNRVEAAAKTLTV